MDRGEGFFEARSHVSPSFRPKDINNYNYKAVADVVEHRRVDLFLCPGPQQAHLETAALQSFFSVFTRSQIAPQAASPVESFLAA